MINRQVDTPAHKTRHKVRKKNNFKQIKKKKKIESIQYT